MAELVPDFEETDEVSEAQGSPLRQRKNRLHFICDRKERAKVDCRTRASLNRTINEWYTRTKTPSVLISLKNWEPCFSCPSELGCSFSSFINNTEVRRAFSRSLPQHFPRQFTSSSNQASQTHGKVGLKSKIPLCSDYSEYSVADLRALVVSAVKSGNSKIIWGRRECQPSWWPQTIAFPDPNNAGKKEMRGDYLVVVMNAYGKHQMQEQQTQPQQQGASNKDSININFENVPFTDI